ncbi:MAG: phosphoglucosamine mutase, partial [[Eubacterium] sulci]|nr:phosphoglucosamine mutase [[Eubacterium] sulci]
LSEEIELFPQVLVNARVHNDNKKIFMNDEEVKQKIADVEAKIGEDGRVLIRPSGTEPLVRVMIEGKDTEVINELAEDLAALISRKFH